MQRESREPLTRNEYRSDRTMGKATLTNILFWCLASLSAVMLVAFVLVLGGFVPLEPVSEPAGTQAEAATTAPTETETAPTETLPAETAPTETTPAKTAPPPAEPEPGPTLVILTAVRGDSWFSARLGSEDGRLLDERVLGQGESVRLEGTRIWLSVGAAGNVDMTVDGKPRALAPGTVAVVVTPSSATAAKS